MSHTSPFPEWSPLLSQLSLTPARIAVLGGVDSGKTTFCTWLLRVLQSQKLQSAYLDLDVGQGELGPPALVTSALCPPDFTQISALSIRGMAFIGDNKPVNQIPRILSGARTLLDDVASESPDTILIDTCGYTQGTHAREFKLELMHMLTPTHIIVLQRSAEMEPIADTLARRSNWQVIRMPVPEVISPKSPAFRAQHRKVGFARYFADATKHTLPLEDIRFIGHRLGSGELIKPETLEGIDTAIVSRIYHMERIGKFLHVIARKPLSDDHIATLSWITQTEQVNVLPPRAYQNLLVGLMDHSGRTFGMGIIQELDFEKRVMHLFSPIHSAKPVGWVLMGVLRVYPDGKTESAMR